MSIKNDYDIPNYGEIKGIVGEIFHGKRQDDYDSRKLEGVTNQGTNYDSLDDSYFISCYDGNSIFPFYFSGNGLPARMHGIIFNADYLQMAYINFTELKISEGENVSIILRFYKGGYLHHTDLYTFRPPVGSSSFTICSYYGHFVNIL